MPGRRVKRVLITAAVALGVGLSYFHEPADADEQTHAAMRRDLLRRARVWEPPAVPIENAALRTDLTETDVECRFQPGHLTGTSAKFDCVLPTGEAIRVKYRGTERVGEAITTTLLRTLGFGADHVNIVRRVRCFGCPLEPFLTSRLIATVGALPLYAKGIDYERERTFEWVAVERKFSGQAIELGQEGWAFHELIDARSSLEGAARTQTDAFLLMAVFLAHWDNKAQNQRLVCPENAGPPDTRCRHPFALIQDAGATLGPRKVSYDGWSSAPIWADRATCTVSMETLPYSGGTFGTVQISDEGRRFLANLLTRLSTSQLVDLFDSARIEDEAHLLREPSPDAWAALVEKKTRAIADGPPCPRADGE